MSIPLTDNFILRTSKPIDNRFVVGTGEYFTDKSSITTKYLGLRVWDKTAGQSYYWDGTDWIEENQSSGNISGTAGRIAMFSDANTVSSSVIRESSGNIGIGKDAEQNVKLAINGNVVIRGNDLYIEKSIKHIGNASCSFLFPDNTKDTIALVTSDLVRFKVMPNGNIGLNVSDPKQKLHIDGNIFIDSPDSRNIKIKRGNIETIFSNSTGWGFIGTTTNNDFRIITNSNYSRIVVKSGGNIGIRTDEPTDELQVVGTTRSTNFISDNTVQADEGFYSYEGQSTSNTNVGSWVKVMRFKYGTYTNESFTLKINASGNPTNENINADIHISFKSQGNTGLYINANVCNYGDTICYPFEDFEVVRKEDTNSPNNGWVYIYHRVPVSYTTSDYTILGKINGEVEKDLSFKTSIDIVDDGWQEKNIISSISSRPKRGDMSLVPYKSIIMYVGSVSEIPEGWVLCNGGQANGVEVPNLMDKFVVGGGNKYSYGSTGGYTDPTLPSHSHQVSETPHSHGLSQIKDNTNNSFNDGFYDRSLNGASTNLTTDSALTNVTINSTGETNLANKNLPPYYALAYIIFVGIRNSRPSDRTFSDPPLDGGGNGEEPIGDLITVSLKFVREDLDPCLQTTFSQGNYTIPRLSLNFDNTNVLYNATGTELANSGYYTDEDIPTTWRVWDKQSSSFLNDSVFCGRTLQLEIIQLKYTTSLDPCANNITIFDEEVKVITGSNFETVSKIYDSRSNDIRYAILANSGWYGEVSTDGTKILWRYWDMNTRTFTNLKECSVSNISTEINQIGINILYRPYEPTRDVCSIASYSTIIYTLNGVYSTNTTKIYVKDTSGNYVFAPKNYYSNIIRNIDGSQTWRLWNGTEFVSINTVICDSDLTISGGGGDTTITDGSGTFDNNLDGSL